MDAEPKMLNTNRKSGIEERGAKAKQEEADREAVQRLKRMAHGTHR